MTGGSAPYNPSLEHLCSVVGNFFLKKKLIFENLTRCPDTSPTDISPTVTSPTDTSPTDTSLTDISPTDISPTRHIPDGDFPDGHFPDQTHPRRTFPRRTLPRPDTSPTDISPTDTFPTDAFPNRYIFFYFLLDCNIFANCNFYLHSSLILLTLISMLAKGSLTMRMICIF